MQFPKKILDAWFSEVCNFVELRYAEVRPRQLWLGYLPEATRRRVSLFQTQIPLCRKTQFHTLGVYS